MPDDSLRIINNTWIKTPGDVPRTYLTLAKKSEKDNFTDMPAGYVHLAVAR